MTDKATDVAAELRKMHDDLNCRVEPDGRRFKSDAERDADIERAMAACWRAADLIEAQAAEIERLRGALEKIAGMTDVEADFDGFEARTIARAALNSGKDTP